MLDSYFLPYQQVLIIVAFFLYLASILLFEFSKKQTFSILFLLLGTLVFKIFVISADEFINLWDEQYHALVAKNLSKDLFFPKLFPDPVLPYDYKNWTGNYVWVHKQPFFLWQMALSIKLLGSTAFAVRLPSALCLTFATFCVYKIGENTLNKRIGYIGALLFSMNYFFSEMSVGNNATDHNDIIFMCYIVASIWAFTEYLKNKTSFKWMLLIALFSSFAVLTKWLPGYLVFGIWFVFLIQQKGIFSRDQKKEWVNIIKTFGLALILPLCWQIYIYSRFPVEAAYEQSFNVRHITHQLDGHSGDSYFYIDGLSIIIGTYAIAFVLLGLSLLNKYAGDKKIFVCFLFALTVVYVFFTFTATKMLGFPIIVLFILFLGFGAIGQQLFDYFKVQANIFKKIIFIGLIIYSGLTLLNLEGLQKNHTVWKKKEFGLHNFRNHNKDWFHTCKEIKKILKDEKYVVFNCDNIDFVKLMFYTDYIGYGIIPNESEINLAKMKKYKIAIIDDGKLPARILEDNSVIKIKGVQHTIVSQDTVEMKIEGNKFLEISPEGKLFIGSGKGSKMVVTTFANNSTQLKTLEGKIATAKINEGGLIVFDQYLYEVNERFNLNKTGTDTYVITTPFREDLVIPENEINFYAKRHEKKKLTVQFVKRTD